MNQFKKTAIAMGVAQIAFMASNAVMAQTATDSSEQAKPAGAAVVLVTGQRAALQSAQKIKQNSDEIVDSIVADDIGKLPDRSVTEVLQRVVGVTMDRSMTGDPQHYAIEGSGVAIRGLTYVRSEMNGRDSFSANGGRSLNFEDVPPELMAGVDVYKNPSAEQVEGAISGLVNLRTAMPFDQKGFKGAISAQTSYSELRKGKASPSYSLLLSNRWNTPLGEFGALIDLAHSESNTRNDAFQIDPLYPRTDLEPGRTVWVPKGALWRTMFFDRDREGKYAAFQWRPNKDLTTSLTFFRSDYTMQWSEQALLMQHSTPYDIQVANGKYDANGAFISGTLSDPLNGGLSLNPDRRVASRDSQTTDIALNTEWRVTPQWRVRADLQSIKAKTAGFDSDVSTGYQFPSQTLDLSGKLPRVTFSDAEVSGLQDPSNYYWAYTMEHRDEATADSKALRLDAQFDFDNPVLRDVRFGIRATDRNSMTHNTNPSYNWQSVTQKWQAGPENWQPIAQLASLGDPRFNNETSLYRFPNFFGGDASVPAVVFPNDKLATGYPESYATLHSYFDILCQEKGTTTCPAPWKPAGWNVSPAEFNEINEKTKAAFVQMRFGFDDLKYPIDGNLGLRYVKTDSLAHGYTVYTQGDFNPPADAVLTGLPVPDISDFAREQDFKNSYDKWLPSLNLRLKHSDKLQFRLAVASSMSRPSFSELQGYTTLNRQVTATSTPGSPVVNVTNVQLNGTAAGNPMLLPTTALSVDVTAEWYPAAGKSITFALFNKELKDIVVSQMSNFTVKDKAGADQSFLVSSPVNGAKGYARGFELAGQTYFDNLPSWAQGLGVQASFTFVDSKRKLYNPVQSEYCSGTGDGATNLDLFVNGCDTDGRTFSDLPLAGLSRRTINFSLMYDQGPISARLAYNWRSRNMQQVAAWGVRQNDGTDTRPGAAPGARIYYGLPLWADDYGQLDGSFFYKFNDKLSLGLEVQNLNNAVFKQDMQQHVGMIGHAWFASGRRYTGQLRYTF